MDPKARGLCLSLSIFLCRNAAIFTSQSTQDPPGILREGPRKRAAGHLTTRKHGPSSQAATGLNDKDREVKWQPILGWEEMPRLPRFAAALTRSDAALPRRWLCY
ncbi:hypothetical protein B0H16DRAFT_1478279 [Mycena metata]|uniref:Secreted protein n=1 Tax=Mycena metata TaxID=1033252 RepID=A0AAD7H8B3_9AGAR|nr:hypothetical protein B0H16DRAFT_1478279 [Mycena metata]